MTLRRKGYTLLSTCLRSQAFVDTYRAALNGCQRTFAEFRELKQTTLYDYHIENGGRVAPFAGWDMPMQYKDSIMESAMWCRTNASIFDVSHMCGVMITGKQAVPFLESIVVGDVQGLQEGTSTLSLMTNKNGGIIDDTVITKITPEEIYLVLNAGCRDKDIQHITVQHKEFGGDVHFRPLEERSMIAVQGPKAVSALQPLVKQDLSKVYFGHFWKDLSIAGVEGCFLTRTGYTGEDGVELSIPHEGVLHVTKELMKNDNVRLAGLAARDALRLEAGLCLYGNDLNEDTTPPEASLTWTIGKRRREKWDFLGGEQIRQQLADGISRRRVGILSEGAPAREGAQILLPDGTEVGTMTSGAYSPNLKKNVGMGYINKPYDKAGTALKVVVRGKQNNAKVAKMPFVPVSYHKPPSA